MALVYLTAFATGVGATLRNTAAATCVPRLVDCDGLDRANGRVIAGQIIGNELAGPAAGGWLFGLAAVVPFAVNAGSLAIAVLLLLTLPSLFQPVHQPAPTAKHSTVGRELTQGLTWLRRHSDIRDLTLAVGIISAMDAAWFAVLVLYVTGSLHQKPGVYGILLAIGAIGGIAAGAAGARLTQRLGEWGSLLVTGLVMAGSQLILGLTANVTIAAMMLAASSAAFAMFNMTAVSLRQRRVPDGLLGRITSLYGTVAGGAEALGALAGGVLATAAGIRATMLVSAAPITIIVIWTASRHRRDQPSAPTPGDDTK